MNTQTYDLNGFGIPNYLVRSKFKFTRPVVKAVVSINISVATSAARGTFETGLEQPACPFGQPLPHVSNTKEVKQLYVVPCSPCTADMLPAIRKVDETEPTSTNTSNIPGFQITMRYSNRIEGAITTHILEIYAKSYIINERNTLRHGRCPLPFTSTELIPAIQSAIT